MWPSGTVSHKKTYRVWNTYRSLETWRVMRSKGNTSEALRCPELFCAVRSVISIAWYLLSRSQRSMQAQGKLSHIDVSAQIALAALSQIEDGHTLRWWQPNNWFIYHRRDFFASSREKIHRRTPPAKLISLLGSDFDIFSCNDVQKSFGFWVRK